MATPAIDPLRPPEGAPNVLLSVLDDVGFGASTAFGGPCDTPTAISPEERWWVSMARQ